MPVYAQNDHWKAVDSLIQKQRYTQAYDKASQLFDAARKNNDSRHILIASHYMSTAGRYYREDNLDSALARYVELLHVLKGTDAAICRMLVAELYADYYKHNRWRINENKPTDQEVLDYAFWDADRFRRNVETLIREVFSDKELLKNTYFDDAKNADLQHLTTKYKGQDGNLTPTLFDMLVDEAFATVNGMGYENQNENENQNHNFASYLIGLWMERESMAKDDKVRIELLRRRLTNIQTIKQSSNKVIKQSNESVLREAIARYRSCEAVTMLMSDLMTILQSDGRLVEAVQLADTAMMLFPQSPGADECYNAKQLILQPNIDVKVMDYGCVDRNGLAELNVKNADKLYFRIIEYFEYDRWGSEESQRKKILARPIVAQWSQQLTHYDDYKAHQAHTVMPKLKAGHYYLLSSQSADFKDAAINIVDFNVSEIVLLPAKEDRSCQRGFVVDRATGKPVKGVKVELQKRSEKNWKTYNTVATTETDMDGFYDFTSHVGNRGNGFGFKIVVRYNKDVVEADLWRLETEGEGGPRRHDALFFDQPVYRPGDTVRFSYLCYDKSSYDANVLINRDVVFTLKDINDKQLEEISCVTDEYGTCSGSFALPADAMPGYWTIKAKGVLDGQWDFNVEAYKQPKFMVSLDVADEEHAFGQTAHLNGIAASYSAVPISNAKVTYIVERSEKMPFWRWGYSRWWFPTESKTVADGEVTTDEKGQFEIEFVPENENQNENQNENEKENENQNENRVYDYIVTVKVTDINGETHEARASFAVGNENRYISIMENRRSIDSVMVAIEMRNLNGKSIDGEMNVEVQRLQLPKQPRIAHPLLADKDGVYSSFTISREDFEKMFPLFDYDGTATDFTRWAVEKTVFADKVKVGKEKSYDYSFAGLQAGVYKVVVTENGERSRKQGCLRTNGERKTENVYYVVYQPSKSDRPVVSDLVTADILQNSKFKIQNSKFSVGDTLRLRIGSRHDDVTAFVVVNKMGDGGRNVFHQHTTIQLSDGWQVFALPITDTLRGGFAVDVAIVKEGCIATQSFDIEVPFEEKKLDIQIETFRNKLEPGNLERWTILCKNASEEMLKSSNHAIKQSCNLLMTMYDHAIDNFGSLNWNLTSRLWGQHYPSPCFGSIADFSFGYDNYSPLLKYKNVNRYVFTFFSLAAGTQAALLAAHGRSNRLYMAKSMGTARGEDGMVEEAVMELAVVENDAEIDNELGIVDIAQEPSLVENGMQAALLAEDGTQAALLAEKEPYIRQNLNTLAFFKPTIRVEDGFAEVGFTVPDLLTEWSIEAMAWTKDMSVGGLSLKAITQKRLMVVPNVPRFLRQGDTCVFSVKVSNMSDGRQDITVSLEMSDGRSDATVGTHILAMIIDGNERHITLEPSSSGEVSFSLAVPEGNIFVANYKVVARGQDCSDGEQAAIPILPNRQMVTESMAFYINGAGEKHYEMKAVERVLGGTQAALLADNGNKRNTAVPYSLTVDLTPNPIWMALQSLPYVSQQQNPSNIYLANSLYTNSLSLAIVQNNPTIVEVFHEWEKYDRDAFYSELDRNRDLKQTIIDETPWLRDAMQEEQRHRDVARFFDKSTLQRQLDKDLEKLLAAQRSDGSWCWIEGGRWPSLYTTQYIVKTFGLLQQHGVNLDRRTMNAINRAMDYIDRETYTYYKRYVKGKGYDVVNLDYLYLRSLYPDNKLTKSQQEAYDFFYNNAKKYNEEYRSLFSQALLSVVFNRHGDKELAVEMVARIKEKALYSDEMGMYWRDNVSGWCWNERPIETQAMLVRTFAEVLGDGESVAKMQQWLLKQKQTTNWSTDVSTVNAIQALMFDPQVSGSKFKASSLRASDITVTFGDHTLQTDTSRHKLHISQKLPADEIGERDGMLTIRKADDGIAWGAMYLQYFEQIDKIPASSMGVTLKRTLYKVLNDGSYVAISNNQSVKVGDKVHVRIEISCDRNLEYVELKDPRCAAFEPVSTASGWRWNDGLSYYLSITNTGQTLYIDRLEKGHYVVEYDLYVNNAGSYTTAPLIVQSLYAPEFRASLPIDPLKIN